jgi:hypothetical protein
MKIIKWKTEGINANVAGHIKPFSKINMYLPSNHPFGKPRPIKHYRIGRIHSERFVKSSTFASVANLIDKPGAFIQNSNDNTSCLVTNYYPNINKTDVPDCAIEATKMFNAEDKAKKRVRSGPTIVKQNYYQRLQEYRTSRCNTYEQKSFHFDEIANEKEGEYSARCPNIVFKYDKNGNIIEQKEICTNVSYNPSNIKFATNNAVESSTYLLDKKKNSVTTTAQTYRTNIETGQPIRNLFIKKNKASQMQCKQKCI